MWEDILKYSSNNIDGREAFDALRNIKDNLITICNNVGLSFTVNSTHRENEYYAKNDSHYHRMLFHLNTIFYDMARNPELNNLKREDRGLRYKGSFRAGTVKRVYTWRKAKVDIGKDKMNIYFASHEVGKIPFYEFNMIIRIPDRIRANNERLILLKDELGIYFINNFDSGNLDVETLVDNIFNHLDLTVVDEEFEGSVREKWWE